jgi:hypothetical protein
MPRSRAKAAGSVRGPMRSTYGAGRMNDVPRWARTRDSVTSVEANGAACLKMLAARRM